MFVSLMLKHTWHSETLQVLTCARMNCPFPQGKSPSTENLWNRKKEKELNPGYKLENSMLLSLIRWLKLKTATNKAMRQTMQLIRSWEVGSPRLAVLWDLRWTSKWQLYKPETQNGWTLLNNRAGLQLPAGPWLLLPPVSCPNMPMPHPALSQCCCP